jgi:hypothetical protein
LVSKTKRKAWLELNVLETRVSKSSSKSSKSSKETKFNIIGKSSMWTIVFANDRLLKT